MPASTRQKAAADQELHNRSARAVEAAGDREAARRVCPLHVCWCARQRFLLQTSSPGVPSAFSLGVRSRVSNVRGDIAARTPAGPSGRHMHTAPPCTVQISRRADAQEELEEVDTCTRDTSTCSRARRIGKRPTTANFRVMDACNVIGCGPGIDCRCHRPRPKPRSARTECTTSSAARSAQCAPSAARRPMSLARPRAALRASGPARCPRAVARKPARRAAARCAAGEAQVREIASSPGGLGRGASRRPAATRTTQTHADQYIPSHEAPRARGGHTAAVGAPARRAPPLLLRAADARKRRSTCRNGSTRPWLS